MLEVPTRVDEDAWAQIVAELTRRRFVAGGVAAGAALLLPGCGGDDGEDEGSSTRIVETGKGRVRVPANPRRVAALGGGDVDTMLALGIEPVAAHKDIAAPGGVPPWRRGRLDPARTKLIEVETGVPLEQVAALKPDLILSGFWGFDDWYEKLSRIAPTIPPYKDMIVDTLEQRTLLLGRAVGREQRARRLLAETDARIEALKDRYPGLAGKSFTFALLQTPTQIGIATGRDIYSTRLMTQLGLHVAPAAARLKTGPGGIAQVSPERVALLDADLMLLGFRAGDDARRAMEGNRLFRRLDAVRERRYVPIDIDVAVALQVPTVLNLPWVLDRLAPGLARVADS